MKRRQFITLLGGAAAWPLAARAQQNFRRIGVLMTLPENSQEGQAWLAAFKDGLQEVGWSESRNVRIDARWGAVDAALQRLATEIIATQPDLILAQNTPTTLALLQHTRTIPIIFANVADPVGSGLVASLPQPGGNVTGFINIEGSMSGKWLELLREMVPHVHRVVFLFNPATAPYFEYYLKPFKDAAQSMGAEPIAAPVHDKAQLESVITAQAQQPKGGMIVMPDSFNINHRREITSLTARSRFPAVYPQRIYTEIGGLLSYGNDPLDNFRRAAIYTDRILRGTKPSELPVQVPVKFELVINLKTAKALGLDVPPTLLARADEVIEYRSGAPAPITLRDAISWKIDSSGACARKLGRDYGVGRLRRLHSMVRTSAERRRSLLASFHPRMQRWKSCATGKWKMARSPRDVHEDARDATRALMGTLEFAKSRNERKKVEMRFAHLKTHHGFERMRLRGLSGARDEFHLAAIVQNLKTLANHIWRPWLNMPAACVA